MNNNRSYWYSLITYLDKSDIDNILYVHSRKIRQYAYILHDKDVKEGGELKESHFHVILYLNNAMSSSAVLKMFNISNQNTFIEKIRNKVSCVDYLTHSNQPDKYQYPVESVVFSDISFFNGLSNDISDSCENALNVCLDIINNVPMVDMVRRYGRDFIINYRHYVAMAELIKSDDFNRLHNELLVEHIKESE